MKAKNIKIGAKVVLKDSTAGGAEAEEARRKNQPFLYIAEFNRLNRLVYLRASPPAVWTGDEPTYTCSFPNIKKYKPEHVLTSAERLALIKGDTEETELFESGDSSGPLEPLDIPGQLYINRAELAKCLVKEFAETMHAEIFAAFHEYREAQGNGVTVLAEGANINKMIVKGKKAAKKKHKID